MDLKNKKILVTGANGFIGSHLTEELLRQGRDVRAFVLYNSNEQARTRKHGPKQDHCKTFCSWESTSLTRHRGEDNV